MKKLIIILVLLILVVGVSIGAYFYLESNKNNQEAEEKVLDPKEIYIEYKTKSDNLFTSYPNEGGNIEKFFEDFLILTKEYVSPEKDGVNIFDEIESVLEEAKEDPQMMKELEMAIGLLRLMNTSLEDVTNITEEINGNTAVLYLEAGLITTGEVTLIFENNQWMITNESWKTSE